MTSNMRKCLIYLTVIFYSFQYGSSLSTVAPPLPTTTTASVRYALLLKELAAVTEKRTDLQTKLQQYRASFDNLQQQLNAKRGI